MVSHVENELEMQESTAELLSTHASRILPQRGRRVNRRSWNSITLDTWYLEGASVAFSVACLVSIYGILFAYNGKQRPSIVYNISLNTIVSILATGCKSSLVFVVGEGISQLKWLWFQDRRKLSHIQTFEDASRGPLGSISLLFQHQGQSTASLGAMILIFMLAFDPMIQQILSYPSEPTITAADTFAASVPQLRYIDTGLTDTDLYSAYYLGIWSNSFNITPSCPSGNCTWQNYRSVGLCSQCSDITSTATLDCPKPTHQGYDGIMGPYLDGKCKVVLPQGQPSNTNLTFFYPDSSEGQKLEGTPGVVTIDSNTVWEVTSFIAYEMDDAFTFNGTLPNKVYSNVENPLVTLAQASLGFDTDLIAHSSNLLEGVVIKNVTQCSLSYCVQNYNVSVTGGKPLIEKTSTDFGKTFAPPESRYYDYTDGSCWRPNGNSNDTVMPPPEEVHLKGNWSLVPSINTTEFAFCYSQTIMPELLVGSVNTSYYQKEQDSKWSLWGTYSGTENLGRIFDLGLDVIMPRIADSLTLANLQGPDATTLPGTIYTNEVIVKVQWAWMILPTLLVILGNLFIACTMYASRRTILWKSSILALLFHGLDDEVAAKRDQCTASSRMEKLAEDIHVQLQSSGSDEHVVLCENLK